jgi:hypothetical protein
MDKSLSSCLTCVRVTWRVRFNYRVFVTKPLITWCSPSSYHGQSPNGMASLHEAGQSSMHPHRSWFSCPYGDDLPLSFLTAIQPSPNETFPQIVIIHNNQPLPILLKHSSISVHTQPTWEHPDTQSSIIWLPSSVAKLRSATALKLTKLKDTIVDKGGFRYIQTCKDNLSMLWNEQK